MNAAVLYYTKGLLWSVGSVVAFWAMLRYGLATRVGKGLFMFIYFATHKEPMVPHAGGSPYFAGHFWFWLWASIVFSVVFLLYMKLTTTS